MGKIRLFGFYLPLLFLVLAVVEVVLISGTTVLSAIIRFDGNLGEVNHALGLLGYRVVPLGIILVLSLAAMGLYQTHFREGYSGLLLRALIAFLLGWMVLALLYYVIPALYIGRGVAALAFIFSLLVIAIFRPIFFKLVKLDAMKPRVLIFGVGEKAAWVSQHMNIQGKHHDFYLIGFVNTGGPRYVTGDTPILDLDVPLCEYIQHNNVDQIVVAVDDRRNGLPMQDLLNCRLAGVEVIELATFFERETGAVALELTDPSWMVFGQGFKRGVVLAGVKRLLDVLLSIILLMLFWPLLLLTAIAIKIEDGLAAPLLYSQTRVGEGSRQFKLYKLRSMRVDAERESGACWASPDDARVTRVGRIIRKLRIDELPQIINVLRGDMSFVGPRPERPEFTRNLELRIRYYRERSAVKPGVTGWAQLRYPYGASDKDSHEKLKYDLFYIKNHNTLFDLLILLQTVEVVIFGKGAR
ncbi:MAG TPA: TIGR03013 family XrtA/PEP-CTERM system glycosyltransferase [Gammaproteobacteria bacterium]|nr:TIGR03013 family XrtA/PEP-CTERM system glycosyltransferase [Gammaproteobacteria bacterium]